MHELHALAQVRRVLDHRGLGDAERGVFGRRDVIFMNVDDLAARGLADGDRLDVEGLRSADGTSGRTVTGLTAVAYDIPKGSVAGYYPEMNRVIALSDHDRKSGTPAYKGVPVTVRRSIQVSEATMP